MDVYEMLTVSPEDLKRKLAEAQSRADAG